MCRVMRASGGAPKTHAGSGASAWNSVSHSGPLMCQTAVLWLEVPRSGGGAAALHTERDAGGRFDERWAVTVCFGLRSHGFSSL